MEAYKHDLMKRLEEKE